jgi:hypothetical protein
MRGLYCRTMRVSDRRWKRAHASTTNVKISSAGPELPRGAAVLLHPLVRRLHLCSMGITMLSWILYRIEPFIDRPVASSDRKATEQKTGQNHPAEKKPRVNRPFVRLVPLSYPYQRHQC